MLVVDADQVLNMRIEIDLKIEEILAFASIPVSAGANTLRARLPQPFAPIAANHAAA
jgi:hypothetical protein